MEKTSLYFKEGSSDKEYHVTLDIGKVTVQYGRRGSALTTLVKCENCIPDHARKVYEKLINEKKAKGYHEGSEGVEYSAPVDPNQTDYRPQLLNEIDENEAKFLLSDIKWLLQEKEDGRNIGIIYDNDKRKAIASNKKGLQISIPEKIIETIEKHLIFNATFCGELVGNVFKVWDVIDSEFTRPQDPYIRRYEILQTIFPQHIYAGIVEVTRTALTEWDKVALYEELLNKNAEGVVFKRKDSLYQPGRPASGGDHLKFKFRATCSVIIGKQNIGKRSVEMWLYPEGDEREVRMIRVGSVTVYPNQEIPKEGSIAEIKYLYAYKDGSLFQPVLKGLRDDVDLNECTISQLKYKRELEDEE